ncbi:MAG: site-2 protease family protein [Candidatus Sulfotelmatobacter sp.]
MRPQIKLGRIAGIEIGLHYSWFVIALLITFSLASHFHAVTPHWSEAMIWTAALVTSVLFFVTLLLHELAHSLVAKSHGLRVQAITLFALGGVSQIESEAGDAKTEFWIAIVGPLTSFLIGMFCMVIVRVAGWLPSSEPTNPVIAVLLWLGYINVSLAVFNMIPGYPLDGGRVLRAVAWWITHNADRATRAAAQVGQAVALLFIVYGVYRFFVGGGLGGLWMAFIGWFLLDAARSSYLQVGVIAGLRGHSVADVMERDCASVESYLSIRDFVDEYLLHSGNRCFVVMKDHHAAGILTANDVKKVSRDTWSQASVQSVMRPLSRILTVTPEMPVVKALELMASNRVDEVAVVSEGKLQGVFSRAQVMRFLQVYSDLGQSHDKAA